MMEMIAGWAMRRRSPAYRWTFATAAIILAVVARLGLDSSLPSGFPYVTFFPAVVLTGFFAGLRAGAVTAVICGLVSWYGFIPPYRSFVLTPEAALALALYLFVVVTDLFLIHVMRLALLRVARAEARSHELAHSRELMFMELQHRVSNNLGVVASLLSLQRRKVKDQGARRSLEEAASRVALVARLQRMLHDPGAQEIDFGAFLRTVAQDAATASGLQDRVRVEVDACRLVVAADQAVPLALIVTELLSNAVEHGFAGNARGTIRVVLCAQPDGLAEVTISDDGKGLPPEFDIAAADSLGLTIARQFTEQLGGQLTLQGGSGTVARLVFPQAG